MTTLKPNFLTSFLIPACAFLSLISLKVIRVRKTWGRFAKLKKLYGMLLMISKMNHDLRYSITTLFRSKMYPAFHPPVESNEGMKNIVIWSAKFNRSTVRSTNWMCKVTVSI